MSRSCCKGVDSSQQEYLPNKVIADKVITDKDVDSSQGSDEVATDGLVTHGAAGSSSARAEGPKEAKPAAASGGRRRPLNLRRLEPRFWAMGCIEQPGARVRAVRREAITCNRSRQGHH